MKIGGYNFDFSKLAHMSTVDYLWVISQPRFHALTRTVCLILCKDHYIPLGKILAALTSDHLREILDISLKDKEQFKILSFMLATAEGQTDLNSLVQNDIFLTRVRNIFFIDQYFKLSGCKPNDKTYSLFDGNKKIYKGLTLDEFLDKFTSSSHEEYLSFLNELKNKPNGKETIN